MSGRHNIAYKGAEQQRRKSKRRRARIRPVGRAGRSQSSRYRAPAVSPSQVVRVQRALNLLGFDAGPEDGKMGQKTRRAFANFQRSINARPTGVLNRADVARLLQLTSTGNGGTRYGMERDQSRQVSHDYDGRGAMGREPTNGFQVSGAERRHGVDVRNEPTYGARESAVRPPSTQSNVMNPVALRHYITGKTLIGKSVTGGDTVAAFFGGREKEFHLLIAGKGRASGTWRMVAHEKKVCARMTVGAAGEFCWQLRRLRGGAEMSDTKGEGRGIRVFGVLNGNSLPDGMHPSTVDFMRMCEKLGEEQRGHLPIQSQTVSACAGFFAGTHSSNIDTITGTTAPSQASREGAS